MKTELMTVPHFLGDGNISTKEQEIQKAYDHSPPQIQMLVKLLFINEKIFWRLVLVLYDQFSFSNSNTFSYILDLHFFS